MEPTFKEQVKKDIWRIAFALIVPPLLLASPFLHSFGVIIFVLIFVPYASTALFAYVKAYRKKVVSRSFYVNEGLKYGFMFGALIMLGLSLLSPVSETVFALLSPLIGGLFGCILSMFFSSLFWSVVVHKGLITKIINFLAFVTFLVLPVYLIIAGLIAD